MVSLNATFLDDLGRVRLELVDPVENVRYRIQRSTEDEPTWVPVRGAQNMSTVSATIVDDYEYTPNIENRYRIVAPSFYDSFNRVYPVGGALSLDGNTGNYASTPDDPSLHVTGDIDIRFDGVLDSWASGSVQELVARYDFANDDRSFALNVTETGHLGFICSSDGLALQVGTESSVMVPASDGTRLAVRATYDSSAGEVTFYTAQHFFAGWTQLGSVQSTTSISIHAGNAPLEVGSFGVGQSNLAAGLVLKAQVRDGINGTIVANPDFTAETPGTTSFVDSTGKTWMVHGDAEIIEFAPLIGSDWGTADTGQEWHLGGSSPGFGLWVDNGIGVIASGGPTGFVAEQLTDPIPGSQDAEITYSAIMPEQSLDHLVEFDVGLRATDNDNYYQSRISFQDDLATNPRDLHIRISKIVGGVETALTSITTSLGTWTPGVPWNARFRVQGPNLFMRAWEQGTDEPVNWQLSVNDTDLTTGDAVHVHGWKTDGDPYEQWFGPMELHTIPQTVADIVIVTPTQEDVFLKSIQYPLFNKLLECVDWQELTRESRVGFHNVKGRHQILGIADVGSSATFELTFITRSKAENRAVVALLTYGGLLLIQPPGDDESEDCPVAYSGIPGGYVMPGESVQARTVYGKPIWQWTVEFTRVAAADAADIVPTTITWTQLWDLIGDEGTWQDVWNTWPTWQSLWLTDGNPETFGDIEG